jgi:uncharacterized phage protein (TIGR01671 family)
MRKIKFRIWDKGRNEWVHDTAHAISLFGEYIIMGEILRRPDDSIVSLDELNDLDAMQFTGLYDRNDKEIYEGDIVIFDVRQGGEKEPAMKRQQGKVKYTPFLCFATWDAGYCHNIKIIGNIYENPELITP